jgi:hypothetical protein
MRLVSYLALATCVGVGGYLLVDDEPAAARPEKSRAVRSAKLPAISPSAVRDAKIEALSEQIQAIGEELEELEAARGFSLDEDDPEAFAMVFTIDDDVYLRLSVQDTATAHGTARLTSSEGVHSVVAPVATSAMPAALRSWAGRTVMVNGDCRARVVGFAEVSRIMGEAGDYEYDEEGNRHPGEPWTVDSVREQNITLAAKLDGCPGTWARAENLSRSAVGAIIEAEDLETAAIGDLLAKDDYDPNQESWKEQGGEGDWRDAVELSSLAWQHPVTNERWIFVQATKPGSCGDPSINVMAAYRATADGTVRRFTDLEFGYDSIQEVVDIDGDGQPELLMGDLDRTELVDLKNTMHDSISVPSRDFTCGC